MQRLAGLAAFLAVAVACGVVHAQPRVRVLEGTYGLRFDTEGPGNLVQNVGRADVEGVEVEVALRVLARASSSALLEQHQVSGLEGACQVIIDGDDAGTIRMRSGRSDRNIWNSLLKSAVSSAFEGTPDTPDADFGPDSNKAEWSRVLSAGGASYRITVRFLYRDADRALRYYVWAEKQ